MEGKYIKKINAPFQVEWQPFPFVPDAQGMFTLVKQIREGLEMYCICTSSNALWEGAKEKMKFIHYIVGVESNRFSIHQ